MEERWRGNGRKVEGEWEKGGGGMGERWRGNGRKVKGEWKNGEKRGRRVGRKEEKETRAQVTEGHREKENILQCHTNSGSILVLL